MRKALQHIARFFDFQAWGTMVILSMIVGAIAGIGALLFQWGLHSLYDGVVTKLHSQSQGGLRSVLVVAIPAVGGLLAGILVFSCAPETEGAGTGAMVRAFHRLKGVIRARVPFVKMIASIITIGTGGSAGKEGPIAQIGAGIGSVFGERFKLGHRERRILMLAGASGGIGAIFRAPLGGALFSAEVLYREPEFEYEAIVPSIISSITAYAVFTSVFGEHLLFQGVESLKFHYPIELLLYIMLGVICSAMGFVYVKIFHGSRDYVFNKLPLPGLIKPAIGGMLIGLLALQFPEVLNGGYVFIQEAIFNKLGAQDGVLASEHAMSACMFLFLLACVKMLATSCTVSSGGSGGVFGPSLFIGAMIGGGFGYLVEALFPGLMGETTRVSLILVGMGGFFAGVAKVPIASLIMVTEMTGSYGLIVPLMVTCFVSFILSRRWTLYREQTQSILDSPAHLGDFIINVLEDIKVRDIFDEKHQDVHTVRMDTTLTEILKLVERDEQSYYPVLDDSERMVGIISLRDIRQVLTDEVLGGVVLAADVCVAKLLTADLDEDLYSVMRKITQKDLDEIPIVDSNDKGKLLGMITRGDIMISYDTKLRKVKEESGSLR